MAHIEESQRPTTVNSPSVILGCQPFVGESYQGPERNREYAGRFADKRNIIDILFKAAKEYRVTTLAAVPPESNPLTHIYLNAIFEAETALGSRFTLAPCFSIPLTIGGKPIDDYRRWFTYYVYEKALLGNGLAGKFLSDPILLTRQGWRTKFCQALAHGEPYREDELKGLDVDYLRLEKSVNHFRETKTIFAELGSETDLLAMTGKYDLLQELIIFFRHQGFDSVFFGVHHAGVTIPLLEKSGINFEGYVTPINRMGALMFPDERTALRAISSTVKRVVAIKIMAGGRIPPREAINYILDRIGVSSFMIGVGSLQELDTDMQVIRDLSQPGSQ